MKHDLSVIEAKWEETHRIRIQDIKTESKLETVTTKYPLIASFELGYLLVNIHGKIHGM